MKRNFNAEKYNGRKSLITKDEQMEMGNDSRRGPDGDRNKKRHSFVNEN